MSRPFNENFPYLVTTDDSTGQVVRVVAFDTADKASSYCAYLQKFGMKSRIVSNLVQQDF